MRANSARRICPLRACLLLRSAGERELAQKAVKVLVGRLEVRTQGCRMLLSFMFTRRSRPSTARRFTFTPAGYSRPNDSTRDANSARSRSLASSSTTRNRFRWQTARHLAWMAITCLRMAGEERKTCFLERSTEMKSSSRLGPPVSCLRKAGWCEASRRVRLRRSMAYSKPRSYWKRSEGMQTRYLRRCEYWSSRLITLLEGCLVFSRISAVCATRSPASRRNTASLRPARTPSRSTARFSFRTNSRTHRQTRAFSRSRMRSPLTTRSNMSRYLRKSSLRLFLVVWAESALAPACCSFLRRCVRSSQYLARRSETRFMSCLQVSMIFCAMLVSSRETSCDPAACTLLLMRCFSEGARLLLRKSEVAQRQRTSSAVMPKRSRCSHLRQMLSRAFTVAVYFLTNWNSTGTLLIFRLLRKTAFLALNSSSSRPVHRSSKNSLLSRIFTSQNSSAISLCTRRARTVDSSVLLRCEDLLVKARVESVAGGGSHSERRVSSLSKSFTFSSRISSKIGRSCVYLVRSPSHSKWFSCCPASPAASSRPPSTTRVPSSIRACSTSRNCCGRRAGSMRLKASRSRWKRWAICVTVGLFLSKSQLWRMAEKACERSCSTEASLTRRSFPQICASSSCRD